MAKSYHQQVGPRLSRSMEDLDSILDRLQIADSAVGRPSEKRGPRKAKPKIPRTLNSLPSYGSMIDVNRDSTSKKHLFYAQKSDLTTGKTYFVDLIRGTVFDNDQKSLIFVISISFSFSTYVKVSYSKKAFCSDCNAMRNGG